MVGYCLQRHLCYEMVECHLQTKTFCDEIIVDGYESALKLSSKLKQKNERENTLWSLFLSISSDSELEPLLELESLPVLLPGERGGGIPWVLAWSQRTDTSHVSSRSAQRTAQVNINCAFCFAQTPGFISPSLFLTPTYQHTCTRNSSYTTSP